jgi:hypothetical protein
MVSIEDLYWKVLSLNLDNNYCVMLVIYVFDSVALTEHNNNSKVFVLLVAPQQNLKGYVYIRLFLFITTSERACKRLSCLC